MADVPISYFKAVRSSGKFQPSNPPDLETPPPVINPPGSGGGVPLTIGTPANGLVLSGKELSLALSSTSTIGALSDTDWNTFNGKQPSGNYATLSSLTANSENYLYLRRSLGPIPFYVNQRGSGSIAAFIKGSTDTSVTSDIGLFINNNGFLSINNPTGIAASPIHLYMNDMTSGSSNGITIEQDNTGDSMLQFLLTATKRWVIGIDNSDSDRFKITENSGFGTDDRIVINQGGNVGIGISGATNTLDVNGTARIRTISNLGSTPSSVLVPSATGVVSSRTLAQFVTDASIQPLISGTQTEGYVATIVGGTPTWTASSSVPVITASNGLEKVGNDIRLGNAVDIGQRAIDLADIIDTGIAGLGFSYNNSITNGYMGMYLELNSLFEIYNDAEINGWGAHQVLSSSNGDSSYTLSVNNNTTGSLGIALSSTNSNGFVIFDNINSKGLEEDADYSANKTDFSYVTKKMLDDATLGANLWTDATTFIYRDSPVLIGKTSLGINEEFVVQSKNATFGQKFFKVLTLGGSEIISCNTSGNFFINGVTTFSEGKNISFGSTTGTRIGTSTTQKLSFWSTAPVIQPTTSISTSTFIPNTSGIVDDTATFDGYTLGQVVRALRTIGLLS